MATPLVRSQWEAELKLHPDTEFRKYILNGIRQGFRISFENRVNCTPAASNMRSARTKPEWCKNIYLEAEVSLGRIVGPISEKAAPQGTQLSPIGVTPKRTNQASGT